MSPNKDAVLLKTDRCCSDAYGRSCRITVAGTQMQYTPPRGGV